MSRLWPKIRRIWVLAGSLAFTTFLMWCLIAYRATDEARQALQSTVNVMVDWRAQIPRDRQREITLDALHAALAAPDRSPNKISATPP